jgi:ELWxxDGT repeat protein
LFFAADDGARGDELWESNGTLLGTNLVADINPGPASSIPSYLTNVGGTLFFKANDGTHGAELWRSGGTAQSTTLVKDINPGAASALNSYETLVNANGTIFFKATDGTHGSELWQSNGTAAGTVMVKDLNPGPNGSDPYYMTNINGTLVFSADDGVRGQELWTLGPLPLPPPGHASVLSQTGSPPVIGLSAASVTPAASFLQVAPPSNHPHDLGASSTSYLEDWVVQLPPGDQAMEAAVLDTALERDVLTGRPLHRRR